jgi:hypothetical protein
MQFNSSALALTSTWKSWLRNAVPYMPKWGGAQSCCSPISRPMWRGTSNKTGSSSSRKRKEVALGCQELVEYKQPDDLSSYNAARNVYRKMALKVRFCGCVRIIESPDVSSPSAALKYPRLRKDWPSDVSLLDLLHSNWAQKQWLWGMDVLLRGPLYTNVRTVCGIILPMKVQGKQPNFAKCFWTESHEK